MKTITAKQQQKIADLLSTMILPVGLGNKENACSIAAINLALTGELTDEIPDCMSQVIGRWIIVTQDSMPSEMRNSAEWKRLLPLAAGTGRKCESERLALVMQWMWETVLPTIQPFADENGFGSEWRVMLQQRTFTTADAATRAATRATRAIHAAITATDATTATRAADAATRATCAAKPAGNAAAYAAATAAATAATAHANANAWQQFNPCGLLQKLIEEVGTIATELEAQ